MNLKSRILDANPSIAITVTSGKSLTLHGNLSSSVKLVMRQNDRWPLPVLYFTLHFSESNISSMEI